MDAGTLVKLTGGRLPLARCRELIPGLYVAFRLAELNSVARRAMWFAQVLEESVGLTATTEFATGAEYEWRTDLGNTHAGDGVRFKGRGFIQLTGRSHYDQFGRWCHTRGLVPNDHWFLDRPEDVASDRFAWLSAAWYWIGDHNHGYEKLNAAADARDIVAATYMVNGAQNGIDTRRLYYGLAWGIGAELMTPVKASDPNWSDVMDEQTWTRQVTAIVRAEIDAALHTVEFGGDHGHWTEKNTPDLHAAPHQGDRDRLARLEKKAGLA